MSGRLGSSACSVCSAGGYDFACLTAGWMAVAAGVVILAFWRACPKIPGGLAAPA